MQILKVEFNQINVIFDQIGDQNGNRISLVTGRNGTGKTALLAALASNARGKQDDVIRAMTWESDQSRLDSRKASFEKQGPSRCIAQTFSPFTRFSASPPSEQTLTDLYGEGPYTYSRYVSIGLSRSDRNIGTGISKRVLEEAFYRFSESPEAFVAIAKIIGQLGFRDSFDFEYTFRPVFRKLLKDRAYRVAALELTNHLITTRLAPGLTRNRVAREIEKNGRDRFTELLTEALSLVLPLQVDKNLLVHNVGTSMGFRSDNFAKLQALSLLRRLEIVSLSACTLTGSDGRRFDIANASSGQQQLLCSFIGLASALRNDCLVLIDEPELSLHPRWQMDYLSNLTAVLNPFCNCHVIIATHSPLIVQQGEKQGIQVIRLGSNSDEAPLGEHASVEETLLEVFETPISDSAHLARKVLAAIRLAEEGGKDEQKTALGQLSQLRALYQLAAVPDDSTLELIDEAEELVKMDPYDD